MRFRELTAWRRLGHYDFQCGRDRQYPSKKGGVNEQQRSEGLRERERERERERGGERAKKRARDVLSLNTERDRRLAINTHSDLRSQKPLIVSERERERHFLSVW